MLMAAGLFMVSCQNHSAGQPQTGFVTGAAGGKIYYQVEGSGNDTLVIVHGGPGAGISSVRSSVLPLAEKHVLIFYDQRGGGRSVLPADTTLLRPAHFVEDLEAVRAHFGLDRMNVLTHSFGAVVLAAYATRYPQHLRRIALHGATAPVLKQELALRRLKAAQSPSPPNTALSQRTAALLDTLLAGTARQPVRTCREYEALSRQLARSRGERVTYRGTTCDMPPEAVAYYYRYTAQLAPRYYQGWDFRRFLKTTEVPLLVIYGREDSVMIPAQRSWARDATHGRLLLVPGAGKSAFTDRPDLVFPALHRFFAGDWPPEAHPPSPLPKNED